MSQLEATLSPQSSRLANESHPTAEARSARDCPPSDGTAHGQSQPIRCKQCAFPIKDRRNAKSCPLCGSDNIEGNAVSY